MNFEKNFPSLELKGNEHKFRVISLTEPSSETYEHRPCYGEEEIEENCLDKTKVEKVVDELFPCMLVDYGQLCDDSECKNYELKKRLGL